MGKLINVRKRLITVAKQSPVILVARVHCTGNRGTTRFIPRATIWNNDDAWNDFLHDLQREGDRLYPELTMEDFEDYFEDSGVPPLADIRCQLPPRSVA